MLKKILFKPISNSQLIVFRIFFGVLMVAECWGAILTGWVNETFIDPKFTFTFFGFEWTQFLIGSFMYSEPIGHIGIMHFYYIFMGLLGGFIALGYRYRFSAFLFTLMWSLCYLMQKSHYNNHYYLVALISWFMVITPANKAYSCDLRAKRVERSNQMHSWVRIFLIAQIAIVYIFAAIAKLYPAWWDGTYLSLRLGNSAIWFRNELNWNSFANFLDNENLALILSWMGFFFDLFVAPLLLIKSTRKLAFFAALLFHLFNSITLHIGIFPYFALTCCVFFFDSKTIENIFFKKSKVYTSKPYSLSISKRKIKAISILFTLYFSHQIYLPLRHWLIKDDVLWTEEGHRLSWRMMLRTKNAKTFFYVKEKDREDRKWVDLKEYLTQNQINSFASKPDMIWQLGQKIKEDYKIKGKDVEIFVFCQISINGGPFFQLTDHSIDISTIEWNYFNHEGWLLPSPKDYSKRK